MRSERINVGQIGYGYWGKILFKNFGIHPGFLVSKICVKDPSKPRPGAEGVPIVSSVSALLNDPNIQAVVVATPTQTHFELSKAVLESGRHLFVEKLFTPNFQEGLVLKKIADDRGLNILVDHTQTFSEGIRLMRDIVRSGAIGEALALQAIWRQLGDFVGEDVYDVLGCHMLSILNMFNPLTGFDFARKDHVSRDGFVGTGSISFRHKGEHFSGELIISLDHPAKERKIAVFGSQGTLVYDMMANPPLIMSQYGVNRKISHRPINELTKQFFRLDESNNLRFIIDHFYGLLQGIARSNIDEAVLITEILQGLRP